MFLLKYSTKDFLLIAFENSAILPKIQKIVILPLDPSECSSKISKIVYYTTKLKLSAKVFLLISIENSFVLGKIKKIIISMKNYIIFN